ncbi:outer membrane beta-barrel protein [Bowmanella sp. JS7-9]|uniref:Outer membrane beta-barrel protein n=1 Tax=Pseudobowmanella zhangzhouensis TaxID=1537679 RepID=A0ABW1XKJ2_9ALTE|nr:outer membrane beta-barrel protein [Bowmanella sp. JS7-9]
MKKFAAVLALGLCASTFAQAETAPNWKFVEGGWAQAEFLGVNMNGFNLGGSAEVNENVFLRGDFTQVSKSGVDLDWTSLGGGYIFSVNNTTDMYVGVSYERVGADDGEDDMSDSGYGVQAGVKSMLTDNFELNGEVGYVSIDGESETMFTIGGQFYVNKQFAIGASYKQMDLDGIDFSVTKLTARYSF